MSAMRDEELSGSGFRYDIEQNAHNLLLLDSNRFAEKELALTKQEEQKSLLHTLRENRNEVLLDTNLLEKKIVQERKSIENVFILGERIKRSHNTIHDQICVSEKTYDQFELLFHELEKNREIYEVERTEYMKIALEAENKSRILRVGAEKITNISRDKKEISQGLLRSIIEETNKNKDDVSRLLQELFMKKHVKDILYLDEDSTLIGAVGKLRKVYTPVAEKNKLLKKAKVSRDTVIKSNNENILKENDMKKDSFTIIDEVKKKLVSNEQELVILRQDKDELVEIFNSKCNIFAEIEHSFEERNKKFNDFEIIESRLADEVDSLNSKIENIQNVRNNSLSIMQEEMTAVDEKLGIVESEQLLLKGRLLEVSQRIELLNPSLSEKRALFIEKENELKVLEEDYNILKASFELQSIGKSKLTELEELLVELKLNEQQIQTEISNKNIELLNLKEEIGNKKICLDDETKKKNIGEQEVINTEKYIQQLKSTIEDKTVQEKKLKDVCSQLERYAIILKDGETLRLEMKKKYDNMSKELADFEDNLMAEIEEKKKNVLRMQGIVQKQKDDQTLLDHFVGYKITAIDQGDVEIMRLKELLREFDHNLAKNIKENQQLAIKLANKNKKNNVENKLYKNMKKQPELKTKEANEKKLKFENDTTEFIFSETQNAVEMGGLEPFPIKREKVDDFPDPIKISEKKFFKSRITEPKRVPIYAQNRYKNIKSNPSDQKKTVFDFDNDDDISVVFVGKRT